MITGSKRALAVWSKCTCPAGPKGPCPGLCNAFDSTVSDITFTVGPSTSTITNFINQGELAGALRFRTEVLDVAVRNLGHLAIGVAATLNEQHGVGQTLSGALGGNLFVPLDQLAPAFFAHNTNTGVPPADLNITVSAVGQLPPSDYLLERVGASHQLTRLSDGTVLTFSAFPGVAEEIEGLRLSLSSGTIADGRSVSDSTLAFRGAQPFGCADVTPRDCRGRASTLVRRPFEPWGCRYLYP